MDMRFGTAGRLLAGMGLLAIGSAALASDGLTPWPTLAPIQTLGPTSQEMFPESQSDPPATLYFGAALAVDDDVALIGMPGYPGADVQGAGNQGAVALFERHAGVWARAGTLRPADAAADQYFGEGVALSRDLAAVQSEGGIYVFRNTSGGWKQIQKLTPPAGVRFDGGLAVADASIFVGAPAYGRPGAVFVFESDLTGAWRPVQVLTSGEGAGSDFFGGQIAVSRGTMVVGAAGDDGGAGAAFIFARRPSGWSGPRKLVPTDAQAGAAFGSAVALANGRIAIGAPQADPEASASCATDASGAVYVFSRRHGQWRQQAKIATPATATCAGSFGTDVAVGSDQVVGATPSEFPYQLGASYVFRRDGATYPPAASAPDTSLVSTPILAISGGVLFDGMPYDRGYSTGEVAIFDLE